MSADVSDSRVVDDVITSGCGSPEVAAFTGEIVYKDDGSVLVVRRGSSQGDILGGSDVTMDADDVTKVGNRNNNSCKASTDRNNNTNINIPNYVTFLDQPPDSHKSNFQRIIPLESQDQQDAPGFEPVVKTFRVHTVGKCSRNEEEEQNLEKALIEKFSRENSEDATRNESLERSILMCFPCRLTFAVVASFVSHVTATHHVALNEREKAILESKEPCVVLQETGQGTFAVCFLEPVLDKTQVPKVERSALNETTLAIDKLASETLKDDTACESATKRRGSKSEVVSLSKEENDSKANCPANFNAPGPESKNEGIFSDEKPVERPTTIKDVAQSPAEGDSEEVDFGSKSLVAEDVDNKEPVVLDLSNPAPATIPDLPGDKPQTTSDAKMSFAVASPLAHTSSHTSSPTSHRQMLMSNVMRGNADSSSPVAHEKLPSSESPEPREFSPSRRTPESLVPKQHGTDQHSNMDTLMGNSSRLDPMFPISLFQSRNSCKTLKCPKCNWHYKYRQTLEAHMKEKHLEDNSDCAYCNAGHPHPRLSRGESYSCGYKPFKCNVCNYSTTTKGNLSIHMQSDKHLYNARNIQQRQQDRMRQGITSSAPSSTTFHVPRQPSDVASSQNENIQLNALKQSSSPNPLKGFNDASIEKQHYNRRRRSSNKTSSSGDSGIFCGNSKTGSPTPGRRDSGSGGKWRCDVCLYETSIARNLRIHMTSEKHAQNLALRERGLLNHPRQEDDLTRSRGERNKSTDLPQMPPLMPGPQGLMEYYAAAFKSLQDGGESRPFPMSDDVEKARKAQAQYLQQQLYLAQQQQLLLAQQYQQIMMAAAAASSLQQRLTSQSKDDDAQQNSQQQMLMQQSQNPIWKQLFPQANSELSSLSSMERKPENPLNAPQETPVSGSTYIFSCGLCGVYGTDDVASLDAHVRKPRCDMSSHDSTNGEWVTRTQRDGYYCKLCSYSTPLKTNFNLHCKTEKHTCKLNLISHVREGGAATEWMIPHIIRGSMTQSVSCNACQFVTHSFEKLKLHCSSDQHQGVYTVCQYLQTMLKSREKDVQSEDGKANYRLKCLACADFSTKHVVEMVKHMQTNEHQLQLQNHKNPPMSTLHDVIAIESEGKFEEEEAKPVDEKRDSDKEKETSHCQYCNYACDSQDRMQLHLMTQHSTQPPTQCPLCKEVLKGPLQLQLHLLQAHNLQVGQLDQKTCDEQDDAKAKGEAVKVEDHSLDASCGSTVEKIKDEKQETDEKENVSQNDLVIDEEQESQIDFKQDNTDSCKGGKLNVQATSTNDSATTDSSTDVGNSEVQLSKGRYLQSNSLIMKVLKGQDLPGNAEAKVQDDTSEATSRRDDANSNSVFSESESVSRSCPNLVQTVNEQIDSVRHSRTTFLRAHGAGGKPKRIRMRSCPLDEGSQSRAYRELLSKYGLEQARQYVENRSPHNRNKARSFKHDNEERRWSSLTDPDLKFGGNSEAGGPANNKEDAGVNITPEPDKTDSENAAGKDESGQMEVDESSVKACRHCGKEFTGLWVLKAHEEVAHGMCVPAKNIQKLAAVYSDQFWERLKEGKAAGGEATLFRDSPKNNVTGQQDQGFANAQHLQASFSDKPAENEVGLMQQQQQLQQQNLIKAILAAQSNKQGGGLDGGFPVNNSFDSVNPSMYMGDPMSANIISQMGIYSALLQAQAQSMGITPYQILANAAAVQQMQQLNLAGSSMLGLSEENSARAGPNAFNAGHLTGAVPGSASGVGQSRAAYELLQKQEQIKQQMQGNGQIQASQVQSQGNSMEIPPKRPRTRITDEQLKILRANFDINNSPSEEQIDRMAQRTALPPKVIKHWFRNTLFKERQRSKDSPYNFNIPPIMTLEDAYKSPSVKEEQIRAESSSGKQEEEEQASSFPSAKSHNENQSSNVPNEQEEKPTRSEPNNVLPFQTNLNREIYTSADANAKLGQDGQAKTDFNADILKNLSQSGAISSNMQQAQFTNALSLMPILSPKQRSAGGQEDEAGDAAANAGNLSQHSREVLAQMPVSKQILNHIANWQALASYEANDSLYYNENAGTAEANAFAHLQGGSCRRTPRTRFTDFQLQVLQDFFDHNAYPKDDDLDKLSQTLNLSTRVIVVWFQNARQKARKSFEQQQQHPNVGRLSPAPEHVRKAEDFSERNSAKVGGPAVEDLARKALSEVSKSIRKTESGAEPNKANAKDSPAADDTEPRYQLKGGAAVSSVSPKPDATDNALPCRLCEKKFSSQEEWQSHQQDHIRANVASMFGQYGLVYMQGLMGSQEQQHGDEAGSLKKTSGNPDDSPGLKFSVPARDGEISRSTFGSSLADSAPQWPKPKLGADEIGSLPFQNGRLFSDDKSMSGLIRSRLVTPPMGASKRKMSTSPTLSHSSSSSTSPATSQNGNIRKASYTEEKESPGMHKDPKRLRTTITPEQLEYLYQQYLVDSSPSRKIIEQISEVVGLKKRVVQVWFQNTRARERKGQFRSSVARCVTGQMPQYKLCHLCRMVFRSKAELDAHIQSRHAQPEVDGVNFTNEGPAEKKMKFSGIGGMDAGSVSNSILDKENLMNRNFENNKSEISKGVSASIDAMKKLTAAMTPEGKFRNVKTEFSQKPIAGQEKEDFPAKEETALPPASLPQVFGYSSIFASNPNHPSSIELQKKLAALYAGAKEPALGATGDSYNTLNLSKTGLNRSSPPAEQSALSAPITHAQNQPTTMMASSGLRLSPTSCSPAYKPGDVLLATQHLQGNPEKHGQTSPFFLLKNTAADLSGSPGAQIQASMLQQQQQQQRTSPIAENVATPTKRYRTQMTSAQVRALKSCFKAYKTPSLAECEILGNEAGLQKRVIQVWFQNARAKEKKRRLQQSLEGEMMMINKPDYADEQQTATECDICYPVVYYTSPQQAREHVFSRQHLQRLVKSMESEKRSDLAAGYNTSHSSPCSSYDSNENQMQADQSGFESPVEHSPVSQASRPNNFQAIAAEISDANFTSDLNERSDSNRENFRISSADSDGNNRISDSDQPTHDYSQLLAANPGLLQHYQQAVQQLMIRQDNTAENSGSDTPESMQQQEIFQQAIKKSLYQMLKLPQASTTGSQ